MDRYDRGLAGRAGREGATVTAELPAASARAGSVLEARDVVKSFGSTPALRGASVSVARGEILAVMGPSGSGKSTLLHCLAGILVPDAGEIRLQGRRIDTLRENERSALRRDRFGFVFQFGQLGHGSSEHEKRGQQDLPSPEQRAGEAARPGLTDC